ncbi:MAG: hypothetical protein CR986_09115 [Ignavibacteriae bacterium]|nr:MAG: hypothetical protein CR986_09115 [Ignavibacteriota bacterium]
MRKTIITLLILFFLSLINLNAQDAEFDSLIAKGINKVYNIKFDEAEKIFLEVERKYPKHPAGKFFDAMIVWWKIALDQNNEKYDDLFEDKLENVIDFCDDLLDEDENNVDAIFFKGGALGFRGRLYSIRQNWFDAALDGKEALPLVYRAYEIDSTNEDVKLGFGIYNYYAEAIPEKYPFIKPTMIFFPDGDKSKGIKQLETAAQKAKYAAIESKYFLLNLYYQFEEEHNKAFIYAEELHNMFPDNPTFEKYYGRIFVKRGDYTKAATVFSDIKNKYSRRLSGYTDVLLREAEYYLGSNYINKNKIDLAEKSFRNSYEISKRIDKEDEESGFQVSAGLYLAKIYMQKKEYGKAKKLYKRLLKVRNFNNSHKKAEKYLKELK